MDFEALTVDHDAFHEEAEERLLGVEVGVEELVGLSRGGGVVMANCLLPVLPLRLTLSRPVKGSCPDLPWRTR